MHDARLITVDPRPGLGSKQDHSKGFGAQPRQMAAEECELQVMARLLCTFAVISTPLYYAKRSHAEAVCTSK